MTLKEFNSLIDGHHVELHCEDHPNLRWSCKRIAVTVDQNGKGRYNHGRNLFYKGSVPAEPYQGECDCTTDKLVLVFDEPPEAAE
jgi:hypothetical protein